MMNRQRGSALILALLILLVMTMLGITAMSTSTLEEKMAANDRNQKLAFQNAELKLAQSESEVRDYDWNVDVSGVLDAEAAHPGLYGEGTSPNYYEPATWTPEADLCETVENNLADNKACRIVQVMDVPPPLEQGGGYGQLSQSNMPAAKLRITAQGRDASGGARVMVQSTYEKNITP
ncbi:hypothetical protein Tel_00840 [Candidatus Tenderia electrophaga]|jgi:type IV pilus assembly protein PilX|uniref:Type 4 fimbrial biogenesis protein PilX N-terminal domain-containing protein n=1 Tax=Candidatus Tenderia electrophaga TaxID=1748243 RepID=A0A0S2T9H2_9GAMM|nr:hypothetical protein Tel_00840 [Candidatus Tenderia electrophaga]